MTESTSQEDRILVVDDEMVVTSLVRDALEDEGYVIETASDGSQALEIAGRQEFDLIVTDIRMPGMDGIELVAKVKELQPKIGVIFMTGYANLNSAKDAIKQGAIDYIMKPFELSEIRQAVRNGFEIKHESDQSNSDEQLSHLSDLNQMLFSTGDRKSLVTSSLKFAMMHQQSHCGCALYYDTETECNVKIIIEGDDIRDESLSGDPVWGEFSPSDLEQLREPFIVSSTVRHPLVGQCSDTAIEDYLLPRWFGPEDHMICVPLFRAEFANGFLMFKFDDDTVRVRESDKTFLSITAGQLAMSLENLSLLEETRTAYARLKEAQEETIELEKMATRGQISAEIGHELNNFVGVVAGNLSLLDVQLSKGNYDKLPRYIGGMTDTIEKIRSFTTNLMDLTPISSKRETLVFGRLISDVVEFLEPQKRYEDVRIQLLDIPTGLQFEADSTQIQQLLYNLFNNAADATRDRDRREITVSAQVNPEESSFSFTIADTGVGIDSELLKKAFKEQFTTKKSGHGFGLMVCNQIIENHGGTLDISSETNRGTSITISFPLLVDELVPA